MVIYLTRRIFGGVVVSLVLGGCAWLPVGVDGNERYNFQHAMLNQSHVAEFPKRFSVPTPLVSSSSYEERTDKDVTSVRSVDVRSNSERASESISGEDALSGSLQRALDAHSQREEVESREHEASDTDVVSVSESSELSGEGLDDILGGSERNREGDDESITKPLSLREEGLSARKELVRVSQKSVGKSIDQIEGGFIGSVLGSVERADTLPRDSMSGLYKTLRNQGLSFETESPEVGDLVFFHNTFDANKDGRNNDWYSTCGVVTSVGGNEVIEFVAPVNGKVGTFSLTVGRPEVRRDESSRQTLNSFLRSKSLSDPEYTQYLAGELFAGFASLPLH